MRSALLVLLVSAPLVASLTACGDGLTRPAAIVLQDTITLALPGTDVASAFDMVRDEAPGLLRFPERAEHAQRWDFALRRQDGALVLRVLEGGVGGGRPGLSATTETFEAMTEAPLGGARYTSEPVALAADARFYLRSRRYVIAAGVACNRFGKAHVLAVDPEEGTARLAVALNSSCNDERLVPG